MEPQFVPDSASTKKIIQAVDSSMQAITASMVGVTRSVEDLSLTLAGLARALHLYDHIGFGIAPTIMGRWVSRDNQWVCGECGRTLTSVVDEDLAYEAVIEALQIK